MVNNIKTTESSKQFFSDIEISIRISVFGNNSGLWGRHESSFFGNMGTASVFIACFTVSFIYLFVWLIVREEPTYNLDVEEYNGPYGDQTYCTFKIVNEIYKYYCIKASYNVVTKIIWFHFDEHLDSPMVHCFDYCFRVRSKGQFNRQISHLSSTAKPIHANVEF